MLLIYFYIILYVNSYANILLYVTICYTYKSKNNQKQQQIQTINVFGEEITDPVCDFLNCYHTFSLHGHRSHQNELNCICKHPQNHAIGIVVLN
jgi:hypothetical protein